MAALSRFRSRWHYRPASVLLPGLLLGLSACTSEAPKPVVTPVTPTKAATYSFKELTWSDEFDGSGLPNASRWSYETGGSGWGNNELEYYTANRSENARVENGNLIIEARKEPTNGRDYSSVRLNSTATSGGSQTYGRFEIKAQLPPGRGSWPAIWMMPDKSPYGNGSWPDNGEIDIMEHVGYDPGVIHASTHCNKYYFKNNNQKTATLTVPDATSAFHVYAIEWTPETITAEIDGKAYFTSPNEHSGWPAWPWDQPFHLILNVAVGGDWGGIKGVDDAAFPQQMRVDYVRFYKMKAE